MAPTSALVRGDLISGRSNPFERPRTAMNLVRPACDPAALAPAVYGVTRALSAIDRVSWRPSLIGSVAALVSFVLLVIANVPVFEDWKSLGNLSSFKA